MKQQIQKLPIVLAAFFIITSCGGGGSGSSGVSGTSDSITVHYDSGPAVYYNETPSIHLPGSYDPLIISLESPGFSDIILYSGYNPAVSLTPDELLSLAVFNNSAGTYTKSNISVMYSYMGTNPYMANPALAATHGTINITRYDSTRIEGDFDVTMVDSGSNTMHISGTFDLKPGITP